MWGYLGLMMPRPPSMRRSSPVVKDESSEARKAIAFAVSPTSPGRPRACVSAECSRNLHFVESSNPGVRRSFGEASLLGVGGLVHAAPSVDVRDDDARVDGVYADAVLGQLQGQALCELIHRRLGHAVEGDAGEGAGPCD